MKNNYFFTVIIPVYNAEKYLEETFESLLHQTIGFDAIEVVLVNDGSQDNSEQICLEIQSRYPENVVYINKPNGGVSSARNEGMKYIHGEYVNFLDADDKWDIDAFDNAYQFFCNHPEIDVVAGRICYFGRSEGFKHALDFKFKENGIIDISEKPDYVQLSMTTCFVKANALKGLLFDERLSVSEDALAVTQVILKKCKYGVLKDAVYYYRKRENLQSAIDTSRRSWTWYFDTPEYCYKELFNISREIYGQVILYVQHLVMYDLQWRIKRPVLDGALSGEELAQYKSLICELLQDIDDDIIIGQKNLAIEHRIYALSLKHGENVIKASERIGTDLYYHGIKIFSLKPKSKVALTQVDINRNVMRVQGTTQLGIVENDYALVFTDGFKDAAGGLKPEPSMDKRAFDGTVVLAGRAFDYNIPIKKDSKLQFELICPDGERIIQNITADFTARKCGQYKLTCKKKALFVTKNSLIKKILSNVRAKHVNN